MERTFYKVDERDQIIELSEVPKPSVGAPLPILLCDDYRLVLSYYLHEESQYEAAEGCAFVKFLHPEFHMFGLPNDEALDCHPLWGRGLDHYGIYRVESSSLVRHLERTNSVHSRHDFKQFEKLTHFIFTFHDSTFECVAQSIEVTTAQIQPDGRLNRMAQLT